MTALNSHYMFTLRPSTPLEQHTQADVTRYAFDARPSSMRFAHVTRWEPCHSWLGAPRWLGHLHPLTALDLRPWGSLGGTRTWAKRHRSPLPASAALNRGAR